MAAYPIEVGVAFDTDGFEHPKESIIAHCNDLPVYGLSCDVCEEQELSIYGELGLYPAHPHVLHPLVEHLRIKLTKSRQETQYDSHGTVGLD